MYNHTSYTDIGRQTITTCGWVSNSANVSPLPPLPLKPSPPVLFQFSPAIKEKL